MTRQISMNALKTYRIGDTTISKIPELLLTGFNPRVLFPQIEDGVLANHPGWAASGTINPETGNVILSVHTWFVKSPQYTILIDTGVGNDKHRPAIPVMDHLNEPYLDRLAAAGVQEPEAVDYVLLTHLHADHAGTPDGRKGDGFLLSRMPVMSFQRSNRVTARVWLTLTSALTQRVRKQTWASRCAPRRRAFTKTASSQFIEAGRANLINIDGSKIIDGISFYSTPGHSIDHASIVLESKGERALFGGDVLHHPLEIYRPDLATMFCEFPDAALRSRRWLLEFASETGIMYFSSHFPVTSAGRITQHNGEYIWEFE